MMLCLSQSCLGKLWEGELDEGSLCLCVPAWQGGVPNQVGLHDTPSQSLVIVVEEGLFVPGFKQLVIYLGAYSGVCGTVSSWTKDGDMVHSHHQFSRGAYVEVHMEVHMLL